MRNTGKDWSHDDLVLLGHLVRDKVSIKNIRTILGRSESAVLHALRNTMYHQLLEYSPEEVAAGYNTSTDHLAHGIVPIKYNVPLPVVDEDPPASEDASYTVWLTMIASLCITGMAYYVHTLTLEWHTLTSSS